MHGQHILRPFMLLLIAVIVLSVSSPSASAGSHRPALPVSERSVSSSASARSEAPSLAGTPAPATCLIYAVNQHGHSDSQLFTISLRSNATSALGSRLVGYDIEGLAIHPVTRVLYATSGEQSVQPGQLFTVDSQSGALTPIGSTGFNDVTGLAFRPADATLWGWAEHVGLIQIDTTTGAGTLKFATTKAIEGLAWKNDGSLLYAANSNHLWAYNPDDNTLKKIAANLPGDVEAFVMRPDDLIFGAMQTEDAVNVFTYDANAGRVVWRKHIASPYDDVEALAWPTACGNPSTGGKANMIQKVTLDKTRVCAGDNILVAVEAKHPESSQDTVDISINGRWGSPQYLQFTGLPGKRVIQIQAATPEKYSDTEKREIEVVKCDPPPEYLKVTLRPNPFHQHTVDFEVANAADFNSQNPIYVWDFGDGQIVQTTVPYAAHFYGDALVRDALYTNFQATLKLQRPGKTELSTRKTVTLWNMYAFNKLGGFIQPSVEATPRMQPSGANLSGTYTIRNLEDDSIQFTTRQLEYQFCDPNREPVAQPLESVTLTIGGKQQLIQQLDLPTSTITAEICGVGISLMGQGSQGKPAFASVYFDVQTNPLMAQPVNDPALAQLLNQVVSQNLVADPMHVTDEDLYRLAREGKITFPISLAPAAATQTTADKVKLASGEDIIGQVCAEGDPPPRLGVICAPTQEWGVWSDARMANAYKGDIILTPGCSLIGDLLRQVSPPQFFTHSGLMVRNYDQIRHSTAPVERYGDYTVGLSVGIADIPFGIRPDVLRYGWPGIITQSVHDAVMGAVLEDPEKKRYEIGGFSFTPQSCGEDLPLVDRTVVKPPPGSDPSVRGRLEQAADIAKDINGHYRFYAYTDAAIATDPGRDAPGSLLWGGVNPKVATVCASFIWYALRTAGITMEGSLLEPEDVLLGAERDSKTMDGLYLYTKLERRAAGETLFEGLKNLAFEKEGFLAHLSEFLSGLFGPGNVTQIANQVTNCFGLDECAVGSKALWRHVADGRAVSPSNMLFWDSPAQGGVYGYNEPVIYRGEGYYRFSRWAPRADNGAVSGRVFYQGQLVPSASVKLTALELADGSIPDPNQPPPAFIELVTDANGAFQDPLLPAGHYAIAASATSNGLTLATQAEVIINAGETTIIDLNLVALPQNYRRVVLNGTMRVHDGTFIGHGPEQSWSINLTADLDPSQNRTIHLAPIVHCLEDVSGHLDIQLQLEEDNTSVKAIGKAFVTDWDGPCRDKQNPTQSTPDSFSMVLPPDGQPQRIQLYSVWENNEVWLDFSLANVSQ